MVIVSMAALLTPTVIFCVLNLVIATIFIASNFKSPHDQDNTPGQLARSPSLLQRVKSVNLSSYYATPESETTRFNPTSQLSRSPSILERVKSFDFSLPSFYATTQPDIQLQSESESESETEQTHYNSPSQLARAPSLLERVKSIKSINFSSFSAQNHNPFPTESEQLKDSRTPANEVKSFKVSGDDSGDPVHDSVLDTLVTSGKTQKSGEAPSKRSSGKMKKSRSERRAPASDDSEEDVDLRRPATMKASTGSKDENVDAKADDFINRFKQQLKLQRLDSIARLKEMLNRGT